MKQNPWYLDNEIKFTFLCPRSKTKLTISIIDLVKSTSMLNETNGYLAINNPKQDLYEYIQWMEI